MASPFDGIITGANSPYENAIRSAPHLDIIVSAIAREPDIVLKPDSEITAFVLRHKLPVEPPIVRRILRLLGGICRAVDNNWIDGAKLTQKRSIGVRFHSHYLRQSRITIEELVAIAEHYGFFATTVSRHGTTYLYPTRIKESMSETELTIFLAEHLRALEGTIPVEVEPARQKIE
jgi:hypothetical protein